MHFMPGVNSHSGLHIVLLCNRFPPVSDGVGDYTFFLGNALAEMGHRVSVICRTQADLTASARLRVYPVIESWNAAGRAEVLRILRDIKPDWLGLQYVPYSFDAMGLPFFLPEFMSAIRRNGIRTWVMFHEVQVRPWNIKSTAIGYCQRKIARDLCGHSNTVLTSIEFYRKMLPADHGDIRVIPVGSNVPVDTGKIRSLRQQWFPEYPWMVSTFGLRDHKNLKSAIDRLNRSGMPVALLVCGKTTDASAPNREPYIRHTGFLPAAQVSACLNDSDLFVLPDFRNSRGEGGTCTKSGSLAAAYANQLPVLGIRGDMTNPLLTHGENIWLIDKNEADDLAEAVQNLLENEGLRKRLTCGGAELFETQLRWDRIAGQHAIFLQTAYRIEKAY